MQHSFVIDKVGGVSNSQIDDANLSDAQINAINMVIDNSTADVGFGPGENVFYAWMPQVPAQFTYYCEQPGHRTAGEQGTLYIGSHSQTIGINQGVQTTSVPEGTTSTTSNTSVVLANNDFNSQLSVFINQYGLIGGVGFGVGTVSTFLFKINNMEIGTVKNKLLRKPTQDIRGSVVKGNKSPTKLHLSDSTFDKLQEIIDENK